MRTSDVKDWNLLAHRSLAAAIDRLGSFGALVPRPSVLIDCPAKSMVAIAAEPPIARRRRTIVRAALTADLLAVVAIVAAFSWVCFRDLSLPGPYEDEVWGA